MKLYYFLLGGLMFQLNSGNNFYRGITSSEIQEWVEEHEGDSKVSLLLNVFCVEVEKIIPAKN